jgi:hypothetical protein
MVQAVNGNDSVEPISIFEIENVHRSPLHLRVSLRERFFNKYINSLDVRYMIDRENEHAAISNIEKVFGGLDFVRRRFGY